MPPRRNLGHALTVAAALALATQCMAQTDPTLAPLIAAAESGDVVAQRQLAEVYLDGVVLPQDYTQAARWLGAAAEAGDARAQNQLGRLLRSGIGDATDMEQAFRWLQAAATQGDPAHVFDLAVMYEQGAGVARDEAEAARLYDQAADQGHLDAAVSLGVLYQEGRGVAPDFARARTLYEAAAAKGHPRAQNNLGLLYTRGDGVAQDHPRAAELFALAAEQGLATAMTNLGVMYENGFGVERDEAKAADLYRLGGQGMLQGDADLGSAVIFDPRLTPPELSAENLTLLLAGARNGDPLAEFLAAYILLSVGPGQRDAPPAADLLQQAAGQGLPVAMANLGLLHFRGEGVVQDYALAHMWFSLAAAAGLPDADQIRDRIATRMTPAQIAEAQRLATNRWHAGR